MHHHSDFLQIQFLKNKQTLLSVSHFLESKILLIFSFSSSHLFFAAVKFQMEQHWFVTQPLSLVEVLEMHCQKLFETDFKKDSSSSIRLFWFSFFSQEICSELFFATKCYFPYIEVAKEGSHSIKNVSHYCFIMREPLSSWAYFQVLIRFGLSDYFKLVRHLY